MLSSVSFLTFLNGYVYSSFSSIPDEVKDYYREPISTINFLVQIFYVCYILVAPICPYLLSRSLHKSLLVSFLMSAIGAWIKYAAGSNFWVALVGLTMIASPTPIFFNAISVTPTLWFPKSQELLAISTAELINYVGTGITFVVSPHISIELNNLLQAIIVSAITLLYILFGKKDPIAQKQHMTLRMFFQELKIMVNDCFHISLVIVVSAATGLSFCILGIMGEALDDENISNQEVSVIGCLLSIFGLFGGLIVIVLESKNTSVLRTLAIYVPACSAVMALWCIFAEYVSVDYILGAISGFFYFGILPLGLRACVDYNRLINDSIPSGSVFFIAQFFAFAFGYPILYAQEMGLHGLWVLSIIFVVCSVTLLILVALISKKPPRNEESFNPMISGEIQ